MIENYYCNNSLNYFDKRNKVTKFQKQILLAYANKGRNYSKAHYTINNSNSKEKINKIDEEISVPLNKIVSITNSDIQLPNSTSEKSLCNNDLKVVESENGQAFKNSLDVNNKSSKIKDAHINANNNINIIIQKQTESSLLLNRNRSKYIVKQKQRSRVKHLSIDCGNIIKTEKIRRIWKSYCLHKNESESKSKH